MKKASAAVIAVACTVGIILIIGLIIIYMTASKESDRIYEDMVQEVKSTDAEIELTPEEFKSVAEGFMEEGAEEVLEYSQEAEEAQSVSEQ